MVTNRYISGVEVLILPLKPLSEDDPDNPRHDARYAAVPPEYIPDTESLKDTIARVMPYWECEIFPRLMKVDNILVVAHGNSLRGIVKALEGNF
jgi:2,3-bisphosphoglycerate-dependent phosphoglycerate mutase